MVQRLAAAGIAAAPVLQPWGRWSGIASWIPLANQAYEDTSLPIVAWVRPSQAQRGGTHDRTTAGRGMCACRRRPGPGAGNRHRLRLPGGRAGRPGWRVRCTPSSACARCTKRRVNICARCAWPNVHLILGDGMLGYAAGAPYAASFLRQAATACHAVVRATGRRWRLVAPMAGGRWTPGCCWLWTKPWGLKQSVLEAVHFVPKIWGCLKELLMLVSRGLVAWGWWLWLAWGWWVAALR